MFVAECLNSANDPFCEQKWFGCTLPFSWLGFVAFFKLVFADKVLRFIPQMFLTFISNCKRHLLLKIEGRSDPYIYIFMIEVV